MNKVEKTKIEYHIANLEDEVQKAFHDITSVEFYIKQLKRHIKECEVENEESEE